MGKTSRRSAVAGLGMLVLGAFSQLAAGDTGCRVFEPGQTVMRLNVCYKSAATASDGLRNALNGYKLRLTAGRLNLEDGGKHNNDKTTWRTDDSGRGIVLQGNRPMESSERSDEFTVLFSFDLARFADDRPISRDEIKDPKLLRYVEEVNGTVLFLASVGHGANGSEGWYALVRDAQ